MDEVGQAGVASIRGGEAQPLPSGMAPSARLFVELVSRYVREGRADMAASAIRAAVHPSVRDALLIRLEGVDSEAAEAARRALQAKS